MSQWGHRASLTCRLLLLRRGLHLRLLRLHLDEQSKKLQSSSLLQFCSRMSLIFGSKNAMSTSIATTCRTHQRTPTLCEPMLQDYPHLIFGTKHDTQPGCAHAIPAHYINKKRVPHDELRSAWNSALELRNLQVLRLYEHGPVGWTQTQWCLKFFRYLDVWTVTADLELCRNKKPKMHEVKSCRNNLWRMHRKCFKAQTERNELNQHHKGFIITENRWC